jgi:hypothetical protein
MWLKRELFMSDTPGIPRVGLADVETAPHLDLEMSMSLITSNAPFKHGYPFEITGVPDCGAWDRRERIDLLLCSLYAAKRVRGGDDWKCLFILTVIITMLLPRTINSTGAAEPSPTPSQTDPGPGPTDPTHPKPQPPSPLPPKPQPGDPPQPQISRASH